MIQVTKVLRKNGIAYEVRIEFGKIEVVFQRTNKGIRETSRGLIGNEKLVDRDQLWIPDVWYKKMWRQVMAIFNEKCFKVREREAK